MSGEERSAEDLEWNEGDLGWTLRSVFRFLSRKTVTRKSYFIRGISANIKGRQNVLRPLIGQAGASPICRDVLGGEGFEP